MSKKRNRDRSDIMSAPSSAKSLSDLEQVDRAIYGDILNVDAERQLAEPIDIFSIYPDSAQPRRVLPAPLRTQVVDGDLRSVMPDVFAAWLELVNNGRAEPFPLERLLYGDEQDDGDALPDERLITAPEQRLIAVVQLASSIRRDGLTNPITITSQGPIYRLETGERRWLAFHLLYAHTGDESYARVPARVVEQANVWRQATENNARSDLNAIAKARQLALLMMDLYGMENFTSIDVFNHEQGFYAQVADGDAYRVPRGRLDDLLNAMGLKNRSQLSRYRALLELPDDIWDMADEQDWTEGYLRQLRAMNYTLPNGNKQPTKKDHYVKWAKQVPKLKKALKGMKPHERDNLLDELQSLINHYR
jgi:hypothetical protein